MITQELRNDIQWEIDELVRIARLYHHTFVRSEQKNGKWNGRSYDKGVSSGLMIAARRLWRTLHPERELENRRRREILIRRINARHERI